VKNLISTMSRPTLLALMVLAAVAGIVLNLAMSNAMKPADERGYGIVEFELAGTVDQAELILDEWGEEGRSGAQRAILLDFGFIVAYTVLLTLAAAAVEQAAGKRGWERTARYGWSVARSIPVAGALDAVENAALLHTLNAYPGGIHVAATTIADIAASIKFAVVIIAIVYIVITAAALVWNRFSHPAE
jgi:hypothetical protein